MNNAKGIIFTLLHFYIITFTNFLKCYSVTVVTVQSRIVERSKINSIFIYIIYIIYINIEVFFRG